MMLLLLVLVLVLVMIIVEIVIGAVCPTATNDKIDTGAAATTSSAGAACTTVQQVLDLPRRQTAQPFPEDVDNFIVRLYRTFPVSVKEKKSRRRVSLAGELVPQR